MREIFSKTEISEVYGPSTWQRVVFNEFEATLTSESRAFPCVFGVSGHKANSLRYGFPDPFDAETVGPLLADYLSIARSLGKLTSLVLFARPGPVQHLETYRQHFWRLLDNLERNDPVPRPEGVARDLQDSSWEFCFSGEPIFVVCNSPAHVLRQSRRSTSFMITFQPRWVFDGITNSDEPSVLRALKKVREHLANFDAIEPAPYLGHYGDHQNREYQQYFIDDTNETPVCPFHSLGEPKNTDTKKKGKVA